MDEYVRTNRALWDEWAAINATSAFYDVEGFKRGGIRLRDHEIREVGDVAGKDLLHLQCHFGIDSLSWARLGARVTGVDFSEVAVATARALAAELGLAARFVCSPLDELPERLDGDFDVVYTSRGVLGWLPDLGPWAAVVARFVRPGGIFCLTEVRPVANAFADEPADTALRLGYPYWSRPEPIIQHTRGSYTDPTAHVATKVHWVWPHSLGEIVTALADVGLRIELLRELPVAEWPMPFLRAADDGTWRLPPDAGGELPLSFSLRARKPA
jgi:SAM-dependent methyltransferase